MNLNDLKFEVLSQDFVQRVEEQQPMPVGRKQVHYIVETANCVHSEISSNFSARKISVN